MRLQRFWSTRRKNRYTSSEVAVIPYKTYPFCKTTRIRSTIVFFSVNTLFGKSGVYQTFDGGNVENLDFPVSLNNKNRPIKGNK